MHIYTKDEVCKNRPLFLRLVSVTPEVKFQPTTRRVVGWNFTSRVTLNQPSIQWSIVIIPQDVYFSRWTIISEFEAECGKLLNLPTCG